MMKQNMCLNELVIEKHDHIKTIHPNNLKQTKQKVHCY